VVPQQIVARAPPRKRRLLRLDEPTAAHLLYLRHATPAHRDGAPARLELCDERSVAVLIDEIIVVEEGEVAPAGAFDPAREQCAAAVHAGRNGDREYLVARRSGPRLAFDDLADGRDQLVV